MNGATTVKLTKPITAHGEEISEVIMREPVPKDLMELGSPMLMVPSADGKNAGIEIRMGVLGRYISRLGSIPMSSVEAMSVADFTACQAVITPFLLSGER